MKQNTVFASLLLCSILNVTAHGAVYLSLEELERSTEFAQQSVFDPVGSFATPTTSPWGSGVLISEDWVLTAGHVGDNFNITEFRLGRDSLNPTHTRSIAEVVIHPGWPIGANNISGVPDLALMRLATPITDVATATRYRGEDIPPRYANNYHQTEYLMAGFGDHGVANIQLDEDSFMRAGRNMLRYIFDDFNLIVYSNETTVTSILDMEWKGAPGDSGGGWFQLVDGEYQLSGITVVGGTPFEYPSFTGAVSVSQFNDWIDSVVAVPEPSSSFLLASIGAICISRRVHRRRGIKSRQRNLLAL
ncbi:Trypsin [Novipirellula aureliae]|uniref:Trypsin n=1 Tax=Novipirellula aureliae TaxID=2527966 RepID=A0A5C6DNL8_9BACT|nr:trypsin-like serine protease [Novipirellula aureliae]TWU37467.1 Trypsin [Novipirellula aureliae]